MRRAAIAASIVLGLSAPVWAPVVGGSIVFRDGIARSARYYLMAYRDHPPLYTVSRISPGDVDQRCDGVCHVVTCQCPVPDSPADRIVLCTRDLSTACAPVIVAVSIGSDVELTDHSVLTCKDSTRCRRRAARSRGSDASFAEVTPNGY